MSILIPNTFANKTTAQLVELDENFNEIKTKVDPVIDTLTVDGSNLVVGGDLETTGNIETTNINVLGSVTITSNLIFSGTNNKITGDFSSTTPSQVLVQSSTLNGTTRFALVPNGTATQTAYDFYASSSMTDCVRGTFTCLPTEVRFNSIGVGTFTYAPMTFHAGGAERVRIDTTGQLKTTVTGGSTVMDSYGCRAWVNFDGTTSGTFTGGTSTVSRTAGSTTATVTTTNNHGLITGNFVYALTGVVAGLYSVTVISDKVFTITTVATTVLTNASITFAVSSIRASGNVSSITDNATGDFTINFATAMPDANYAATFGAQPANGSNAETATLQGIQSGTPSTTSIRVRSSTNSSGASFNDLPYLWVSIFR